MVIWFCGSVGLVVLCFVLGYLELTGVWDSSHIIDFLFWSASVMLILLFLSLYLEYKAEPSVSDITVETVYEVVSHDERLILHFPSGCFARKTVKEFPWYSARENVIEYKVLYYGN